MELHYPLKYGCAADVVTGETDRSAYVPPPIAREDHAETCRCEACRRSQDLFPTKGK